MILDLRFKSYELLDRNYELLKLKTIEYELFKIAEASGMVQKKKDCS